WALLRTPVSSLRMESTIWPLSCAATSATFWRAVCDQERWIRRAVLSTLSRMTRASAVRSATRRRRPPRAAGCPAADCPTAAIPEDDRSGVRAGDEPGAAVERDIGPEPLRHYRKPVAVANQEEDMDHAPEQPGRVAGRSDPAEVGNGRSAADGGQAAEVAIAEGPGRSVPGKHPPDACGNEGALLLGGRRQTRNGAAAFVEDQGRVADDEDSGMARKREVGPDLDASGAVLLRPQPFRRRRGGNPGGPDDAIRRDSLTGNHHALRTA